MSELRRPIRRDGPVLPTATRVLFLVGPSAERDAGTLQQLSALAGQVQVTTVTSAAEVSQRVKSGFHALVISHGLPQAETLALISALRKGHAPVAIVPVVTETQRDLYASAVAVGADDVLILLGGTLLHPTETLVRVRQSRYLPPHEVEAVRAAIRGTPAPAATAVPAAVPDVVSAPLPVEDARESLAGFSSETTSAEPAAAAAAGPSTRHETPGRLQPRTEVATPESPASTGAREGVWRDLESRLSQAEAEAASRREAHAALVASKLDLEQSVKAHQAERAAWERQRKELLAAVQQANDAHAAERAAWEAQRRELEQQAGRHAAAATERQALAAALEEARAAVRATEQTRATEHDDWARERAQLAARMTETQAALESSDASADRARRIEADLATAQAALEVERKALREAEAVIARHSQAATTASQTRDQLERALDAARAELRVAAEGRQAMQADLSAVRARAESLASELASATTTRDGLEASLDAVRAELASATRARTDLEERLASLSAELADAAGGRAELERARADAEDAERARAALADQFETARAERAALEASVAALGADLHRLQEAAASDRRALGVATEQGRAQRIELEALDHARQQADALLNQARAERDAAEERAAAARRDAEALETAMERLRTEAAAATDARDQHARELAEARAAFARTSAEAEHALAEARAAAGTLADTMAAAARGRAELEQSLADLEADRQRLLDEHRAHRSEWDATREELERRLRDAESAASAVPELNSALSTLTDAQAAERMEWMTARLGLETRVSQLDDELERQRDEVDALGAELSRVAARHDRLARSELFGYAVTTLDGWLVHCNDAFARLLGYANARDAIGRASEHAFGADGNDLIAPAGLSDGHVRYRDARLTRADGLSIRVLQTAVLVTGHGQDPLVERVFLDLSDRTALEERLRQAQRLETLGRLTVAMAPELEALAALVDAGLSAPPDPLDEGSESVTASATLLEIRQLLAFIRKQARPAGPIDLNDALERIAPVLARLVGSHVDFAVRLGPTTTIAGDEEDFEQMATALVVAARDWLAAGGSLTVETGGAEPLDTDRRPTIGVRGSSGASLTVTATGYGVELADLSSTLESVVERCGGTLHLGGVAGRRMTLRVQLPTLR